MLSHEKNRYNGMRVYSGNAKELLGPTQTDELEVVWFLEAEWLLTMLQEVIALRLETPILVEVALITWWVLEAPMARAGWTSSTTECLTLRRAVGVVQPWWWRILNAKRWPGH